MPRLTKPGSDGYIVDKTAVFETDDGYSGEAIKKLAKFEDIYDNLNREQEELSGKLEVLKNQGKTKTAKFRELMAKKLMNLTVLSVFKTYEID